MEAYKTKEDYPKDVRPNILMFDDLEFNTKRSDLQE